MRPLDEQETTVVFEKLYKFVGSNLKHIVERPSNEGPDGKAGIYCFRLHKNRVFYVSEALVKRATNIARDKLVSLGTCIGKFTKGGKFQLTIQCLGLLAAHAKYKIWLKPTAEMSFLYGNHVLKGGLGRITENTTQNEGVVIFSMSDIPLGFGVAAKSTQDSRKLDPNGIVAYHQADIGEYLRMEDELQKWTKLLPTELNWFHLEAWLQNLQEIVFADILLLRTVVSNAIVFYNGFLR